MWRTLHKIPGLVAALFVTILAVTGFALSVFNAVDTLDAPRVGGSNLSVASFAQAASQTVPGLEQLKVTSVGHIVGYSFEGGIPQAQVLDPETARHVVDYAQPAAYRWIRNLHRSLFLDDTGRIIAGVSAFMLLVLAISGAGLIARRMGGWPQWFAPMQGSGLARLHGQVSRWAVAGLVVSTLTAVILSLTTFDILPLKTDAFTGWPDQTSGAIGTPVSELAALQTIPMSDLQDLTFPYPGDASDAFEVKTRQGAGFVDQGNGRLLVWADAPAGSGFMRLINLLHTGEGAWILGLLFGLAALSVPFLAISGVILWARSRSSAPKLKQNTSAQRADTILLTGSEGGATKSFSAALHNALVASGHKVHSATLNAFAPQNYAQAQRIIIATSTYGDGDAPQNANRFLELLAQSPVQSPVHSPVRSDLPIAVLGFGDSQFPQFCGFALAIEKAVRTKGWPLLMPTGTIDKQSPQAFAQWGADLGTAMGEDITLTYTPPTPRTQAFTLISREDYGQSIQAPTAVLRFGLPVSKGLFGKTPRFAPGDLVGICLPGTHPRYYSVASHSASGVLEICVRKQIDGLCSGHLHGLQPGAEIEAFIQPNPAFRPAGGTAPVILIGAGAGIGPLVGFLRENRSHRPMFLYFGARDPQADFLYEDELTTLKSDGQLQALHPVFSRAASKRYVQDELTHDAPKIAELLAQGAQVMVCGGRDMATGVASAIATAAMQAGLSLEQLKHDGRYLEDVY